MNKPDTIEDIANALNESGAPTGNEHEVYPLAERIRIIAVQRDYYRRKLDEARAKVAELESSKADTDRMNWLDGNQVSVSAWMADDPDGNATRQLWQCDSADLSKARDNIRDAIDAAMITEPCTAQTPP